MTDSDFRRSANRQLCGRYVARLTDEQLLTFVKDFLAGQIFTSAQAQRGAPDMGMIFMPLIFGALEGWEEKDIREIGILYEYLHKAGPRAVNGYPMFTSFRMMHRDDWERCRKAIEREQERKIEV
jgi:hypothetical protein